MAISSVVFARRSMPAVLTTVFTYNSVKGADTVGFIEVVNGSDVEATVYVYIVPNAQVAGDDYAKMNGARIPPHGSKHVTGWWPLVTTGDTIQCSSVGTRLAFEASGIRRA